MSDSNKTSDGATAGIGFGCALAMVISYANYHSVVWAILHGICSWLFVIWWCIWGEVPA